MANSVRPMVVTDRDLAPPEDMGKYPAIGHWNPLGPYRVCQPLTLQSVSASETK